MDEGGHHAVPDVVVLTVGVEARGGTERRVGGGGTRIPQGTRGTDQGYGRHGGEAEVDAQGHIDGGDDGHCGEGGTYPHGDQQANQQHQEGGEPFLIPDHRRDGLHQALHPMGLLHHGGEAGGGDHDEADEGHHAHALGEGILALAKLDDATAGEDDETGEGPQHYAVGHQLQPQGDGDGQQGDPDVVEVQLDGFRLGGQDLLQIILARLAIAEEDRHQQPDEHAEHRYGHRQRQLAELDRHPVVDQVLGQDVVEEDATKAYRQQHVGRGQAEGDDAGHLAAIDLHLGHDVQQRRDQDGNEGDVDRDQVLGGDGDPQYRGEQQALDPEDAGRTGILAELADHLAGQQVGDPGAGDGHREGPQHGVGEGDFGAATQPAGEGAEGLFE
ncbi:hypothetical protein D3C80_1131760 [compost metagenome]